jgi:CBS-domain-containing membrane protein
MAQHQVRRLPVVDDENRLVGVVSQADIALEAKDQSVGEMVADISRSHPRGRGSCSRRTTSKPGRMNAAVTGYAIAST